jgi:predicted ATPase/class 3 adenylate cyclase
VRWASGAVKPSGEVGHDLPVTFLFSDIEASTRRWERDAEGMAEDLRLHDALLQAAVEQAGGAIFSHTGDGMCAAFPTAAGALQAAVAAQVALHRATWAVTPSLRVRMAVHAGPAQRRAGNYFGPTLNRTARLMAVGSGGQVLCSQAGVDAFGADLSSDVNIIDLGEHRLADLAAPERVYQVVHPELPSEFPPLRSLGVHRHNLPPELTPFVGRALEVKELDELLRDSRLVTVTGAGGVGKTRVALEVARGAMNRYPDGTWLVELAALRDGSLIGLALAESLGLDVSPFPDPQALTDHVLSHLSSKRALVVFDNCEHLVGAAAALIRRLLTACPAVAVLATTREVLGMPGEVMWRAPSLSLPPADASEPAELLTSDAGKLFWERARASRPGFELTPANSGAVVHICRRLDGIPLALELAAARLRVVGPQQIAERLDDCFGMLRSGDRTAVPRHQTLRAALDWSYELLTGTEQAALRRLGVFPSSFALDAAEAVLADVAADTFEVLARLIDQSLVVVLDEGDELRYRLLEPIRQYAAEQLRAAGEDLVANTAHRDFFLAFAERWPDTFLPPERVRRVCADSASFSAALEWSLDHGDSLAAVRFGATLWVTWLFQGRPDAPDLLERIVAGIGPDTPLHPARAEVLLGLAVALGGTGRAGPARIEALFEEAAGLAAVLGDRRLVALHDGNVGRALLVQGRPGEARAALRRALGVFEELGHGGSAGWCHDLLGWAAMADGDHNNAQGHFDRAAALARVHDPEWLGCQALSALAPLTVLGGDPDAGLRLADQAVAAAAGLPTRQMLAMALTRAAQAALLAGDLGRGAEFLGALLRLLEAMATRRWVGDALEMTALHREQLGGDGAAGAAAELFGACDALRAALGEGGAGLGLLVQRVEQSRRRVGEELGPELAARHLAAGRSLPLPAAIGRALEGLAGAPPASHAEIRLS